MNFESRPGLTHTKDESLDPGCAAAGGAEEGWGEPGTCTAFAKGARSEGSSSRSGVQGMLMYFAKEVSTQLPREAGNSG